MSREDPIQVLPLEIEIFIALHGAGTVLRYHPFTNKSGCDRRL